MVVRNSFCFLGLWFYEDLCLVYSLEWCGLFGIDGVGIEFYIVILMFRFIFCSGFVVILEYKGKIMYLY